MPGGLQMVRAVGSLFHRRDVYPLIDRERCMEAGAAAATMA